MKLLLPFLFTFFITFNSLATDYHIGPGQPLANIADAPWDALLAGDRVYIHWRSTPYKEKWVINAQGTAANRIEIIGVSDGPNSEQPVIDGDGAVTPSGLNYWNEPRGVIKIGGSNVPADGLPSYITIENLEVRSGRPAYSFTNDQGASENYVNNCAAIYVEKAAYLIIRNCTLHDCGNGLFIGADGGQTEDIMIEGNSIYDNGIVGSIFEHNTYTEAINITYQYNHLGPLRAGADGNNLKDRSAGLIVRNNWIEAGNRQLDLVDAEGSSVLVNHPLYSKTYVYGNILIEPDGAGNSQIIHYGGDSGTLADYRKGDLYLYNNTIISTRSGNTTLIRLSTIDETANVFNNVIYVTASGSSLAMIGGDGVFNYYNNWMNTGWVDCHCTPSGTLNDLNNNVSGSDPLFVDFLNQNFRLQNASALIDQGSAIPSSLLPTYNISKEYVEHQSSVNRPVNSVIDIGAFESIEGLSTSDLEAKKSIRVFPNPFHDVIELGLNNIAEVIVYDARGNQIYQGISQQIDLSTYPNGLYFITISTVDGINYSEKLVKM
jgi:Secretion system C-terminal sorting domain